jgi:hypothetical protein
MAASRKAIEAFGTLYKYCPQCTFYVRREDFAKNKNRADGLHAYCLKCKRAEGRRRASLPNVKATRSKWAATKGKAQVVKYKERWPAKRRARELVQRAVIAGRMVNPRICSQCSGTNRVEAHHDDYAEPLAVRWLCRICHRTWHRENGPGRNAAIQVSG